MSQLGKFIEEPFEHIITCHQQIQATRMHRFFVIGTSHLIMMAYEPDGAWLICFM